MTPLMQTPDPKPVSESVATLLKIWEFGWRGYDSVVNWRTSESRLLLRDVITEGRNALISRPLLGEALVSVPRVSSIVVSHIGVGSAPRAILIQDPDYTLQVRSLGQNSMRRIVRWISENVRFQDRITLEIRRDALSETTWPLIVYRAICEQASVSSLVGNDWEAELRQLTVGPVAERIATFYEWMELQTARQEAEHETVDPVMRTPGGNISLMATMAAVVRYGSAWSELLRRQPDEDRGGNR